MLTKKLYLLLSHYAFNGIGAIRSGSMLNNNGCLLVSQMADTMTQ